MLCFLLLATALPVVDFTEAQAASTNTGFTGWKTSGSKNYYYGGGYYTDGYNGTMYDNGQYSGVSGTRYGDDSGYQGYYVTVTLLPKVPV